jgi:hypothetical protein
MTTKGQELAQGEAKGDTSRNGKYTIAADRRFCSRMDADPVLSSDRAQPSLRAALRNLKVDDYYHNGARRRLRLPTKRRQGAGFARASPARAGTEIRAGSPPVSLAQAITL